MAASASIHIIHICVWIPRKKIPADNSTTHINGENNLYNERYMYTSFKSEGFSSLARPKGGKPLF